MRLLVFIIVLLTSHSAFAENYMVSAGDQLQISVFQDPKLDRQVLVRPDGKISFPLAGHVMAAERSLEALEAALTSRLQKFYNEQLDVSVALASVTAAAPEDQITIYIMGEIRNPGQFILREQTNVLQAIALSGGLGTFASKRRIQVRRHQDGVDILIPFDYTGIETGENFDGNFFLQDGDVIVVPEKRLFE